MFLFLVFSVIATVASTKLLPPERRTICNPGRITAAACLAAAVGIAGFNNNNLASAREVSDGAVPTKVARIFHSPIAVQVASIRISDNYRSSTKPNVVEKTISSRESSSNTRRPYLEERLDTAQTFVQALGAIGLAFAVVLPMVLGKMANNITNTISNQLANNITNTISNQLKITEDRNAARATEMFNYSTGVAILAIVFPQLVAYVTNNPSLIAAFTRK